MPSSEQAAMKTAMSEETARDIGEIKGLLIGVKEIIASQNESMNRRIDDMHASNTRRLDDLNSAVSQRLEAQDGRLGRVEETANEALSKAVEVAAKLPLLQKQIKKSSGVTGGGAGAVIALGVELIKAAVWG